MSAHFTLSWRMPSSLRNRVGTLQSLAFHQSMLSTADVTTASFHRLLFKDYCTVHQLNEALLMVRYLVAGRPLRQAQNYPQAMKLLDNKLSRSLVEISTHKEVMTTPCEERALRHRKADVPGGCLRSL